MDNTTNAELIPTIIAQKTLGKFGSYINLARTVARDFDFDTRQEGETINVVKRGNLTANSIAQGDDVTKQTPTATKVSVTLDQHFEVTFTLDDVTKVLQDPRSDALDGYAEDAVIALVDEVEDALAGLYASVTASAIAFDETSTATKKASLLTLRKAFTDAKVPKVETKYLYMSATSTNEILEEDTFTQMQSTGSTDSITEGAVRKLYGFEIFESQAVAEVTTVHKNLAYTKNAVVLAMRPLPEVPAGHGAVSSVVSDPEAGIGVRVVSSFDADKLRMQVTLDVLFGVAIVDQRRIRLFELDTSS